MVEEDLKQQPLLDADLSRLAHNALHNDQVETLIEQQIGPYRLLRLLGEGGSGVVYLAERSHLGGFVAIKLLRHAWMSPMRRERFALEQRTLARLNHPGIARIYDAGTLDDHTPWFVMEFVDGQRLTDWLADRNGTVREDLLLFRQICDAVRYANSLAIIHRDLKPSNILVTAAGEVKLLDFGIAKQLDTEQDPVRTVDGLRMMTPAYAAPEQHSGGEIGIFTDVYALGVILYEILASSLPAHLPSGTVPSTGAAVAPSTLSLRRSAGGRRPEISRREWDDLDVLCLTAMAPLPEQRYRTVDALLQDVDAYLEERPLVARPPSWHHAALKFVARHRSAVAAVVSGLVILIVGSAVFTVRLARARDQALAEAARVMRIQSFTESLFDAGDSDAGPAVDLKTSDLLQRGEIEAEALRGDPRMQADLFATLGMVYQRLGSYGKADALLQRALQERRASLGERDLQYMDSLYALGILRRDQRRMDEAEGLLREAVARRREVPDKPGLEQALVGLGSVLSLRGQYEAARTLLEEARKTEIATHAEDTALYAETLGQLSDVAVYQADYDRAEALGTQAVALDRKLYGNQHPETARKLNSLGAIATNQGRFPKAESLLREALAADTSWYGPSHPDVADDLTSLGHVLTMEKRYPEAEAMLDRALEIEQHAYGENHSRVATTWNQIGVLAYSRDQDDKAEHAFRKAMAIYSAVYGPTHQFVGLAYSNLMGVDMDRKDYVAGEADAARALQIYAIALPPDHVNVAIVHLKLGRCLMHEKRYAEAEKESLKAYRYFVAHRDADGSYLPATRRDLTEIAAHLESKDQAQEVLQALQTNLPPAGSP